MSSTTAPKTAKTPKPLVACWCGCGGETRSRFVPGHDARFHGWAKKVIREEMDAETVLAGLAHDEARAEFLAYGEKITDAEELRKAKMAAKVAAKAAKEAEVVAEPAGETAPAEVVEETVAA